MTRSDLGVAIALGLMVALFAAPSWSADPPTPFTNFSARLACHQRPLIVAFGSSTIEGLGASGPSKHFTSMLPRELHKLEPNDPEPIVLNRGIRGEDVDDMIARLDRDVIAARPDTVIWQLGTNDAIKDMPIPHFLDISHQIIDRMKASGIDVVLMDPQRTPVADAAVHAKLYLEAIQKLGKDENVLVIPRYGWMIGWLERYGNSIIATDRLHMSDIGYALLTKAVARLLDNKAQQVIKATAHPDCGALAAPRPA